MNDAAVEEENDGYEDEETAKAMMAAGSSSARNEDNSTSRCPMLLVTVAELPMGAKIELEVMAATQIAYSCLDVHDYYNTQNLTANDYRTGNLYGDGTGANGAGDGLQWDTGHDYHPYLIQYEDRSESTGDQNPAVDVEVAVRWIGHGCAAFVTVTVGAPLDDGIVKDGFHSSDMILDTTEIFLHMFRQMQDALEGGDTTEGLPSRTGLSLCQCLQLRLYYAAEIESSSNDNIGAANAGSTYGSIWEGTGMRSSFENATASFWTRHGECSPPATTVVPVSSIKLLRRQRSSDHSRARIVFAIQAMVVDPVHLETEIWIHRGR